MWLRWSVRQSRGYWLEVTTLVPLAAGSGPLTPAIFGLVGVLLGALVAAGVDVWVQRRREKAEVKAEEDQVRASIRLVLSVIGEVEARLKIVLAQWSWYVPEGEQWTAVWNQERSKLAAALGDEDFKAVATAFVAAREFQVQAAALDGEDLDDGGRCQLGVWQKAASAASDALERSRPQSG